MHPHSPSSEFGGNIFVRPGRCSCIWTGDYSFHQASVALYNLFKSEPSLSGHGQPNTPAMSWLWTWQLLLHFILCSVFWGKSLTDPFLSLLSHIKSVWKHCIADEKQLTEKKKQLAAPWRQKTHRNNIFDVVLHAISSHISHIKGSANTHWSFII